MLKKEQIKINFDVKILRDLRIQYIVIVIH
jgi:hypothetical protein